jgi:hypothetical protein
VQIKTELLNLVLAELLAIESDAARATLLGLYAPRWRRFVTRLKTDRFGTVDAVRKADARARGNSRA